jgi:hypothetical protein
LYFLSLVPTNCPMELLSTATTAATGMYGGVVLAREADLYPSARPFGLFQVPRTQSNFTVCYCEPDPTVAATISRELRREDNLEWATVRAGPMNRRSANTFSLAQSILALFGLPSIKNIVVRLKPDPMREHQCAGVADYGHGSASCTRRDYKHDLDYFVLMECIHTAKTELKFVGSIPTKPYVNPRAPMEARRVGSRTWESIKAEVFNHEILEPYIPRFGYIKGNIYPYTMVKVILARYVLGLTNMAEENFVVVRKKRLRHGSVPLESTTNTAVTDTKPVQVAATVGTPVPLQLYDIYNVGTYNFYRENGDSKCISELMGGMRQFNVVWKAWIIYFDQLLVDMNQWLATVRSNEFEQLCKSMLVGSKSALHYDSWSSFRQSVENRLLRLIASPNSFKQLATKRVPIPSAMRPPPSRPVPPVPRRLPLPPLGYAEKDHPAVAARLATKATITKIIDEKKEEEEARAEPAENPKKRPRSNVSSSSNSNSISTFLDQGVTLPQSKKLCLRTIDEVEGFDGTVWVLPLFPQMPLQPLRIPVYM